MSRVWLWLIVFVSGFAMLGIELAGSRLLAPFFGSSLLVWANLIGLILFAIAFGNFLGGRWADRAPRAATLWQIFAWAGCLTALLPILARPILALAIPALKTFDAVSGAASFVGVLVLFVAPMTLFGMISPFAIRLAARDVSTTGTNAGNLYALSTAGSLLGVYLTVFIFIPTLGTRATFFLLGIGALVIALLGLVALRQPARVWLYVVMLALVLTLAWFTFSESIKAANGLIYETDSPYNFIQVYERGNVRALAVNEGLAEQSVYRADGKLSGGIWDLFLLAPQFAPASKAPRQVLIIGLAAGTVAKEFTRVYGALPIDGVEIDPTIVAVGQKYFAMNEPNLHVVVADGRTFLNQTQTRYDVIALDAYHQPYIPFHLATVEFFVQVREHLTPNGVVALNAARTATDFRLVNALAATMHQVFPTVIALDHPTDANTLLVAANQPLSLDHFTFAKFDDDELNALASQIHPRLADTNGIVLTDDRAPIENLIDSIILDYALR